MRYGEYDGWSPKLELSSRGDGTQCWTAMTDFDNAPAYDAEGETIEAALSNLCATLASQLYKETRD